MHQKKQSKIEDLEIGNLKIVHVRSVKYLGTIVNEDNSMEEEIKERIKHIIPTKECCKVN
jgi:hypothetical protein